MRKVPSRPSTLANHMPSSVRLPIVSLCSVLSSGEVVKVKTNCGLSKPWAGVVAPTQRTACNEASVLSSDSRSVVIDRAFAFDPFPILRSVADERFLAIGHAREAMNFVRLELEDRQLLPLQRIDPDLAEQLVIDRHDERLFADARVDIVSLDLTEGQSEERMLAGRRLRRVFRGEGAEGQAQLRLVEPVLRQIRSGVGDEPGYLLFVQGVEQAAHFVAIGRLVVAARDRPGLDSLRASTIFGCPVPSRLMRSRLLVSSLTR